MAASTRAAARVAVFIDGDAMTPDRTGFRVDWKRLREREIAAHPEDITTFSWHGVEYMKNDYGQNRPLIDFLSGNGYRVRPTQADLDAAGAIQKARQHVMVTLAVHTMLAVRAGVQEVVLWAGDGVMVPVVTACQDCGASVTIIGAGAWCSNALKAAADNFVDVTSLRGEISVRPVEAVG